MDFHKLTHELDGSEQTWSAMSIFECGPRTDLSPHRFDPFGFGTSILHV